ncbi:GNAT family N-acetyltransferase, partial [Bacteriovoracaceae bacterium]|nr:GNAT family N-acetyltransferase [Bacteriovoracaceae bacterium]
MAKETENLELDEKVVGEGVKKILQDPKTGFYVGAFLSGELVASFLILYEWSDWRCRNVLWLHSLYVKPELRDQGIFKKMYNFLKSYVSENSNL